MTPATGFRNASAPLGSRRRSAFTLVELLVVIAIIGILVSLLLPAVQAARESGRMAACKNNMRQQITACYMHLDTQGHFPYGWDGRGFGWTAEILPYIGEQGLFDTLNREYGDASDPTVLGSPNQRACATVISVYRCPSMDDDEHASPGADNGIAARVPGSYGACASSDATADIANGVGGGTPQAQPASAGLLNGNTFRTNQHNGIFFGGSDIAPRQITDGLSKTIALGERFANTKFVRNGNSTDYWYIQSSQIRRFEQFLLDFARDNGGNLDEVLRNFDIGQNEMTEFAGSTNAPLNAALNPAYTGYYAEIGFGSWHFDGAHFAFADSSIRYITNSIDPGVYRPMGSRRPRDTSRYPWEGSYKPEEEGFSDVSNMFQGN